MSRSSYTTRPNRGYPGVNKNEGILETSASWINAVEGFFAKLTNRRLKRGVFHSIVALQAAINRFIKEANQSPKPFRWAKEPDEIIAAVRRGHQALDSYHSHVRHFKLQA